MSQKGASGPLFAITSDPPNDPIPVTSTKTDGVAMAWRAVGTSSTGLGDLDAAALLRHLESLGGLHRPWRQARRRATGESSRRGAAA
jgi:hypothetical protein